MNRLHVFVAFGFLAALGACREAEHTQADQREALDDTRNDPIAYASTGFSLAPSEIPASKRDAAIARAQGHIKKNKDKIPNDADHLFEVSDLIVDRSGEEHVRFDRRYKGLRVFGGDLVVHSKADGSFGSESKAYGKTIALDINRPISPDQALANARNAWKGASIQNTRSELLVYARESNDPKLAYEVVIEGSKANEEPSELHAMIDARTGALLNQWEGLQTITGTGKGYYSGTVSIDTILVSGKYQLKDATRGNQATFNMANKTSGSGTLFTDADNIWGNSLLSDTSTLGVDAQYGAAKTWDFYLSKFGRKGLRNDGVGASSRVHYGRSYNNAFWSDSCFCMTYGDGDGKTFSPFVAIDVAGHEMSHGLTAVTAKLVYSGESGGLNEANSDILGTMVEYYANLANDVPDYQIGEKLYKSGTKALRYMYNPSLDGASASCYSANVGSLDVHYSSGVANHFFYLLAEGTNGTNMPVSPTCNSSTLVGIGRDAATAIWYRALTVYMTSSTNYAGARVATLKAAADLYTATSPQYNAVAAAWTAVSVN